MAEQTQTAWFITGTSRGIGLEFTRQLSLDPTNVVIATARNPEKASELEALKSSSKAELHIIKLDVANEESIRSGTEEAVRLLGDRGLDYLLNNAGVNPGFDKAFEFSPANLQQAIQSNVVGPALIAQQLLPLLKKGRRKVIMNMSTGLASFGLDLGPKCVTYTISKTALNMLTYKQAMEEPEIISVVFDPGWVKTEMGGEGASLEPHESVTPFISFLKDLTHEHSGKFFSYKGISLPW